MLNKFCLMLAGLTISTVAGAHGQVTQSEAFMQNLLHPFHGLDHLLVMIAVGIWAASQRSVQKMIVLPLVFVVSIPGGLVLFQLTQSGIFIEPLVVVSVLLLGLVLLTGYSIRFPVILLFVASIGALHGQAHVAETAVTSLYPVTGMMSGSLLLHLAGLAAGLAAHALRWQSIQRVAGAGLIMASGSLATGFF